MIEVANVRYRYPDATDDALAGVNWSVPDGHFVIVAGQSGSGKSSLLRCLNGLIPDFHGGYFAGDVIVGGRNTRRFAPRDLAPDIGIVFQDPEAQLVTDTAEDEITFALNNFGFGRTEIPNRVATICRQLGIEHIRSRQVSTLSGGERQLVAIAATMASQPTALLLDEPTSQLDPQNAQGVIETLERLNRTHGLTVILAEHRLGRLLSGSHSVALMLSGILKEALSDDAIPDLVSHGLLPPDNYLITGVAEPPTGDVVATMNGVHFSYDMGLVLQDIDFAVRQGETIALTGPNGSGKTSLLKLLIGLIRPDRGSIQIDGTDTADQSIQAIARTVGYVPQHPTIMLHQESAEDELQFTLDGLSRRGNISDELAAFNLQSINRRHPLDLSGGERQRLAIAAITIGRPDLLLLDEPTRGLSWSAKRALAVQFREYAATGRAAIVATHDEDFVRVFASRVISLDGGKIAVENRRHLPAIQPDESADTPDSLLTTSILG